MKTSLKILVRSPQFIIGTLLILIVLGITLVYPMINTNDPTEMVGSNFEEPNENFILGTDGLGRDMMLQISYGIRNSLYIGVVAGIIATLVGLILGLFGGYLGGMADNIINTITNIFIVIPSFVILILISVSLTVRSSFVVALVIGITSWPWTARAVRAQTASLRNRDHVNIAKISGYSTPKIIMYEILPYIASYVTMAFIMQVSSGILSEAGISMLGLGADNIISLGNILNWAITCSALMQGAWWAFLPPTIVITMITFGLLLINTGMDEIFNPKIRS